MQKNNYEISQKLMLNETDKIKTNMKNFIRKTFQELTKDKKYLFPSE